MAILGDTSATKIDILDEIQVLNIEDVYGSTGSNTYILTLDENGELKWVPKTNIQI